MHHKRVPTVAGVTVRQGPILGEPAGFIVEMENGYRICHAGDTAVFGDMAPIRDLHRPDLALLPIGGQFTMDPLAAALAVELLGVRHVLPRTLTSVPWRWCDATPRRFSPVTAGFGSERSGLLTGVPVPDSRRHGLTSDLSRSGRAPRTVYLHGRCQRDPSGTTKANPG
jgi:Beta-lactamase superfamily domain